MKKGFTLIEMIAIVVLLGILGLIAVVSIDKILKENQERAYNIQVQNIIDGAKLWANENVFQLPQNDGEFVIITLGELKNKGYIKDDITNPITNEQFNNNMQLKITVNNNNYNYEIVE